LRQERENLQIRDLGELLLRPGSIGGPVEEHPRFLGHFLHSKVVKMLDKGWIALTEDFGQMIGGTGVGRKHLGPEIGLEGELRRPLVAALLDFDGRELEEVAGAEKRRGGGAKRFSLERGVRRRTLKEGQERGEAGVQDDLDASKRFIGHFSDIPSDSVELLKKSSLQHRN
jgi:hypothetical protein